MPYGLKDEDFDKIQNKIAKKLYEIPSLDRAAFLMGCTEQELREAMTELRKTPKSRGKIVVEDVKSPRTRKNPEYIIKRKLMLERYGITIREVA